LHFIDIYEESRFRHCVLKRPVDSPESWRIGTGCLIKYIRTV